MGRYAWLEFDCGMWHLVQDLYADPGESTRRWPDRDCALAELLDEGWSVVRPYSLKTSTGENEDGISGYGLVRIGWRAELPLSIVDTTTDGDRRVLYSSFMHMLGIHREIPSHHYFVEEQKEKLCVG